MSSNIARALSTLAALGVACVTVAALEIHASRAGSLQTRPPSTDRLVAATIDYVRGYQEAFRFLVADEVSEQRVLLPSVSHEAPSQSRDTRGEMFLTYLDVERQWTAVHDVMEVNGVAVADRDDLPALLRQGTFASVARRIFDRNERFNIGRVRRNFNDPMLALLPFTQERRSRFSFSRGAIDPGPRAPASITLAFQERERPTIVRNVSGGPVFARGAVVIDPATSVVHKATISFRHDEVDAELTTDFVWEDKLSLWVPSVFTERYEARREKSADVTTVESRYSNYRRFEVTGRLR